MSQRRRDKTTARFEVDPLVGELFDNRFIIEEKIGFGGFGAVYRARYADSLHQVALKVLLPELNISPHLVVRFRRRSHFNSSFNRA